MKKTFFIFVLSIIFVGCTPAKYKDLEDGLYAEIKTDKGDILMELFVNEAPMTVANFISLAEGTNNRVSDSFKGKKYYDGLTFHRVVPNFVIQGGDPTATGKGGPGYVFGDEIVKDKNGKYINSHDDAGVLSMANSGVNSNGSQFYITHKPILYLDEKHTVFGKTIINSTQLEELKLNVKDSTKFTKAIDSLRMVTVNGIRKADTIRKVEIIRIGSKAKSFDAPKVFDAELLKFSNSAKEKKKKEKAEEEARYSKYLQDRSVFYTKMDKPKAKKYDTGLSVLKLISNPKGRKIVENKPVKAHFILYTADGKKIQSTKDSGAPFVFQLDDAQRPMITGFKEGVKNLRVGEKARLFIPYSIGFGEAKYGPFPAKSDLIFDIEILEIGK